MPTPFDNQFQQNSGNLNSQIRVVGAGNTVITFNNKLVILCESVDDTPPALASRAEPIQGIGDQRPVAIVPSTVQGAGTLTLKFVEKYPSQAEGYTFWQQTLKHCGISGLENINSIAALMAYQRTSNFLDNFKVAMYFMNPTFSSTGQRTVNDGSVVVKTYENPVITNVTQREQINNGTIKKTGDIEIMYTHNTWSQDGMGAGSGNTDLSVVSLSQG